MLRLMIVDDEEIIRTSISKIDPHLGTADQPAFFIQHFGYDQLDGSILPCR